MLLDAIVFFFSCEILDAIVMSKQNSHLPTEIQNSFRSISRSSRPSYGSFVMFRRTTHAGEQRPDSAFGGDSLGRKGKTQRIAGKSQKKITSQIITIELNRTCFGKDKLEEQRALEEELKTYTKDVETWDCCGWNVGFSCSSPYWARVNKVMVTWRRFSTDSLKRSSGSLCEDKMALKNLKAHYKRLEADAAVLDRLQQHNLVQTLRKMVAWCLWGWTCWVFVWSRI